MLTASGQTIPVTPFSFDQDLRVLQLQGKFPVDYSMNVRPISFNKRFNADSLYQLIGAGDEHSFKEAKVDFFNGHGKLALLPVSSITKFTSHHPYGWSDGSLMPLNGLQQMISLGAFAKIGPFSLQFKPEIVYAGNSNYDVSFLYGSSSTGTPIKKLFPGQSRLALNVGPLSFAVSSENIWWGPGQFSSLIISSNAPGFFHASFNSSKPIKTPIGKFEWQIIAGRPRGNDTNPEEVYSLKSVNEGYGVNNPDFNYSKYINAISVSYMPSFLSGVTIGGSRAFISGAGDVIGSIASKVGTLNAFLPVFSGLFKEKRIAFEDSLQWNQLVSLYIRTVVPRINAEFYVEFGWNDHKYNMRDLLMSPSHSAAYLIGFKKLFPIGNERWIDLSTEYNQMAQSADFLVRDAGGWYSHSKKSNFSHFGEVLGSGIGYGSNLLTNTIQYRNKYNLFGIVVEQLKRGPTFYNTKWSELSIGFIARKKVNSFLFNARLSGIQSKNYGWEDGKNRFNFMGMMGVSYFF